ncbi:MAG TPA: hypothetical protein DEB47_10060, partial [Citreicella sp.]|nr:hypothetical protein [Citreicella sp.]
LNGRPQQAQIFCGRSDFLRMRAMAASASVRPEMARAMATSRAPPRRTMLMPWQAWRGQGICRHAWTETDGRGFPAAAPAPLAPLPRNGCPVAGGAR